MKEELKEKINELRDKLDKLGVGSYMIFFDEEGYFLSTSKNNILRISTMTCAIQNIESYNDAVKANMKQGMVREVDKPNYMG